MTRIVLASKSAARSALLSGAGVTFDTAGSGVDEDILKQALLAKNASPADVAIALADAKALAVTGKAEGRRRSFSS